MKSGKRRNGARKAKRKKKRKKRRRKKKKGKRKTVARRRKEKMQRKKRKDGTIASDDTIEAGMMMAVKGIVGETEMVAKDMVIENTKRKGRTVDHCQGHIMEVESAILEGNTKKRGDQMMVCRAEIATTTILAR
mmetsp:Transcript_24703/g.62525  ORF Transcript_24703/g.62525 Transcript_24703/m.62525 type:complete len:134 (-) Transcript_24703:1086-1487(-)